MRNINSGVSGMSDFKSKLGKARQLHRDMTKLISICKIMKVS